MKFLSLGAILNSCLSVKIKKGEKCLLYHIVISSREKSQNTSKKCLKNVKGTATAWGQLNISTEVEAFNFLNEGKRNYEKYILIVE